MMVMMMIDHCVKILCSHKVTGLKESCYFVQQRYRYISVRAESELATCRTSEWSLWSPVAGVSRVCLCAVVAAPEGSSALPRMAYRRCKPSRTDNAIRYNNVCIVVVVVVTVAVAARNYSDGKTKLTQRHRRQACSPCSASSQASTSAWAVLDEFFGSVLYLSKLPPEVADTHLLSYLLIL